LDPIQVRTYRDDTAEAAAQRFQIDSAEAARSGYYPTSQVWEGSSLTVTYQRREAGTTEPVAPPAVATSSPVFIPAVASDSASWNERGDLLALPQTLSKPLVWLPFGLLMLAFALELARQNGALPEGEVTDLATLYIQLTLPPTALFVFLIGGVLADRGAYLVGGLLGALDALLITILVSLTPASQLEEAGITEVVSDLLPLWGIAIVVGIVTAGFAGWIATTVRNRRARTKAVRP
jgi:hypothetical protein